MRECAVNPGIEDSYHQLGNTAEQYYSVEFPVEGLRHQYQFKIWSIESMAPCVLMKEDSGILNRINVGDVLTLKYYPADSRSPFECHDTAIMNITKNDHGKFKGHYLVGLKIVASRDSMNSN
jgi:hypothetical protein